jgi:hypothetical protein
MIAVGTPCYVRASNYPELTGHVCVVVRHGPCGREHNQTGLCHSVCRILMTHSRTNGGDDELCVDHWSSLIPLVPPGPEIKVVRRRSVKA